MRLIRSRIIYVLLIVCAMVYASLVRRENSEILLYAVIILPIFTLVYTLLSILFVKVETSASKKTPVKGDSLTVTVKITNRFILPVPYLTLYTTVDRDICYDPEDEFTSPQISLAPYETREIELDIVCRKHGYFTAGLTSFALIDYLRLFRIFIPNLGAKKLLVYPSIRVGNGALLTSLPSEFGSRDIDAMQGSRSPEFSDVRPYIAGDPFNRIHRNLSIRGTGVYTREYEHEGCETLTLIYDLPSRSSTDTESIDIAATLATTFFFDAMDKGLGIRLITAPDGERFGIDYRDFTPHEFPAAFEVIASCVSQKLDLDFENLNVSEQSLFPHSKLFIITTEPSDALLCFASRAYDEGLEPVLLSVKLPKVDAGVFDELGIDAYIVSNEEDDPIWSLI